MQTALAPKMAAVPARFAGAQGAGPPPICVSDRMRRAWTDAIVPAFFRVAGRVDGVLGRSPGGRRRLRRRFAGACLGWRDGCAPGRGDRVRISRLRGLVPSEKGLETRVAHPNDPPKSHRSSFTNRPVG